MNKADWMAIKEKWQTAFEDPRIFDKAMSCLKDEDEFSPAKAWCEIEHE